MQCPLCSSTNNILFHEWPDFRIVDCVNCGFRFTDLTAWSYPYQVSDYYADVSLRTVDAPESAWIARRVKAILKYCKCGRSIDIGCGLGEVAIAMQKRGFDAEGMDESKNAIDLLKQSYPTMVWHCGSVHDVLPKLGSFDVVTLYHVLEHIPDPVGAMRNILTSVRPGGIVVLEVPNVKGLSARLRGHRWRYYLHHHVNYFGPSDLMKIGSTLDCEVLDVFGDYDFTYPTGSKWKVAIKSILKKIGFKDVVTIVMRVKE